MDAYAPRELKPWIVAFGSVQIYFPQNQAQELSAPVICYSWTSRSLYLTCVARSWQCAMTDTPTMRPVMAGYNKAYSSR